MPGQADGSIIIDTELDSKGFKAGSAELLAAIKSLTSRVEKLQKQMQKVGAQKIATDEYKQVQQDIAQAEKYLDQYNQKRAKLSEKGKVNTSEWKALTAEIKAASAELSRLRMQKAEMERTGTDYISGTETAYYQSLNASLISSRQKLIEMQAELVRINSEWAKMPTLTGYVKFTIQNIGSAIKSSFGIIGTAITHPLQATDRLFGSLLQKSGHFASTIAKISVKALVSGMKSAASSMAQMVRHGKSMNGQFGGLISGAKKFALSLLGARGVYALLRKAVNAYMAENQQLSNTLSACWSGIGNALGPIITKLINLVATAIAYVTQFLNLLGFVGKSTTEAISSAGGAASKETDKLKRQLAPFDELNILSDNSSDSSGGGGGSTDTGSLPDVILPDWVQMMVDQLKSGQWAEAAKTLTSELNAMIASVDWAGTGEKIAYFLDGALTFLATAITTFDWYGLGADLGEAINSIIHNVDWANFGVVLGAKFIALIGLLGGLFATIDWAGLGKALSDGFMGLWNAIDWKQAAKTLSDGIIGVLNTLSSAIKNVDWQKLGNDVATFIANVDWSGVFTALSDGIGAALGGLSAFLWGLIEEAWGSVVDWWYDVAYEDGSFTMEGLLQGIWDKICDIGTWIKENIFQPFIDGFKSAFGINSPSTVMQEQGGFIVEGLLLGLQNAWTSLGAWIEEAFTGLTTTVTNWASEATRSISDWANDAKRSISTWASDAKSSISTWASDAKSNVKNWASNTKSDIGKWVDNTKSSLSTWTSETKSDISNWTSDVKSNVSTWASNVKSSISTWASNTKSSISTWASSTKSNITSWASTTKSSISSWASNMYSTIQSKTNSVKSTISSGFSAAKSSIVSNMQSAMNTIKGQNWNSVGTGICSGIQSGLNAGWSWLRNTVSNLARNLLSAAKSALGIHSPSRLFRDAVGLNIGYGIGEGIEDSEGSVLDSVSGVADAIADEFNAKEYAIGGVMSNTDIDNALTTFSDKIAGSFASLMDRLQAIADSTAFKVPAAAAGAIPYKVAAADGNSGASISDTIEASNEELSSVVIQAVTSATAAIVNAIQEYSGATVNLDANSLADTVISEINRKTRMNGKSPLLI